MNLYSARPSAFDDDSISIATHATLAVVAALREEQFRAALTTRDVIDETDEAQISAP